MPAATASIADVPRTDVTSTDGRNKTGQCTPVPLPALGTQKIIQGNGTNVGTVISLQCPDKHRLVGSELMCVMDTNSTHWVGETYCKPLSPYEDYGFRVAVLASIVSSAIILLMSMAFITCCLLDCIKEEHKEKEERESDRWQWEEQAQHQEESRSRYSHKGRNNNNNNAQEKTLSLWDTSTPALFDSTRACRCHQQYAYNPACTYGPAPPMSALPGYSYDQPLLPRHPESAQICGPPPQYYEPHLQATSPGLGHVSGAGAGVGAGPGPVWQYGMNPDESSARNIYPTKDPSIRIISV